METVGKYLKRERELRNISLKEVSTATKIRENILKAIEEDRHDLLPTPVFVKGFLVAYVKHVGLDPSDVVLRYESDLNEFYGHEEKEIPAEQKKGWDRRFLLATVIVMAGIGIMLFNPWKEPRDREEEAPAPIEETPVVQEEIPLPLVIPDQDKVPTPGEETIVVKKTPPIEETIVVREVPPAEIPTEAAPEALLAERTEEPKKMVSRELTLRIQAVEETWIALQVDSDLPREITLRAGETFSQRANDHIKLKIGNAGGVNVTFNGRDLGILGDPGRVVRLSLTQEGYEFKERDDF
ncbi:MAG: helix-turn-helix domain-containing protein [Thermodesulfobacteriota bacterium]